MYQHSGWLTTNWPGKGANFCFRRPAQTGSRVRPKSFIQKPLSVLKWPEHKACNSSLLSLRTHGALPPPPVCAIMTSTTSLHFYVSNIERLVRNVQSYAVKGTPGNHGNFSAFAVWQGNILCRRYLALQSVFIPSFSFSELQIEFHRIFG